MFGSNTTSNSKVAVSFGFNTELSAGADLIEYVTTAGAAAFNVAKSAALGVIAFNLALIDPLFFTTTE